MMRSMFSRTSRDSPFSARMRNASPVNGRAMRLTMNPGVSLASTQVLPIASVTLTAASSTSALVRSPGMTSTSGMMVGGLKKCIPTTLPGSLTCPAMALTDSVLVLVARIAPSQKCSSLANNLRFTSRFSGAASIARSIAVNSLMSCTVSSLDAVLVASSSVILPLRTSLSRSDRVRCTARSRACGSRSYRHVLYPDRAATCAMPAPIVPAPRTAIERMSGMLASIRSLLWGRQCDIRRAARAFF